MLMFKNPDNWLEVVFSFFHFLNYFFLFSKTKGNNALGRKKNKRGDEADPYHSAFANNSRDRDREREREGKKNT